MGDRLRAAPLAILLLLALMLIASFWVLIPVGDRGVWTRFGRVQPLILDEGLHFIIPLVDRVTNLSIRIQKQETTTEAASQDLQSIFTNIVVNWHILPEKVNRIFQKIGSQSAIVECIIDPAITEVVKAVISRYTAEETIIHRDQLKATIEQEINLRLAPYFIIIDDLALIDLQFSPRFREAVESKQIAQQEEKQAEFMAKKAIQLAEFQINLAKGEAESHRILQSTLTPNILHYQTIQRWDGSLPLITDNNHNSFVELDDLIEAKR
ncbi:prohibitin family protein [Spirulina sp. CCNP1310]|uniref:prohibitin family protein n=1 Tax=Spirulina sp. CCNP1310 TaxID=3110249 RepID=UPI002B21D2B4|nr:prohibitin family protein [Spirulina sp. CCNP1310]